ncbi:MAG: hypothetical protein ACRC62_04750 [Microcoleus sp.]
MTIVNWDNPIARTQALQAIDPILLILPIVLNAKQLYTNGNSSIPLSLSFMNLMPIPLDFFDRL